MTRFSLEDRAIHELREKWNDKEWWGKIEMILKDSEIKLIEDKGMVIQIWRSLRNDYSEIDYLEIVDLMRDSAIEHLDKKFKESEF